MLEENFCKSISISAYTTPSDDSESEYTEFLNMSSSFLVIGYLDRTAPPPHTLNDCQNYGSEAEATYMKPTRCA